jgi:ribulose-5-phosphate 4-epimerase/fuculose-1-phosphate aldolase
VADSSPIDPETKQVPQERYIHGEIYKRFSNVISIVHSQSEAVLPYTMNRVPMLPTFHVAGFLGSSPYLDENDLGLTVLLGEEVPVFNISRHYDRGDQQDMLVNNSKLGAALAAKFVKRRHEGDPPVPPGPNFNVVLMQNHGFTTFGSSIQQAVCRAIYTHVNAGVQSTAIMLRNAQLGIQAKYGYTESRDLKYLTPEQIIGCQIMNEESQEKPWSLWVREVEACPLYVNNA